MTDTDVPSPIVPTHIEEIIQAIAKLHAEHHQNATPLQRGVDRTTDLLGRPWFIGVLTVFVICWISLNLLVTRFGYRPIDPPPFVWLEYGISLASFYMVFLILTTQRREDELAQRRDQLTLELVISNEQKTAKVIQLLEELRRDSPVIRNRVDPEADAMAQPADPSSVLDAIKETHAEAEKINTPTGPTA